MSFRTILVHLDHSPRCAARELLAAQWARAHEAHLTGILPTGIHDGVIPADAIVANSAEFIAQSADFLRRRAEGVSHGFRSRIEAGGRLSFEVRMVDLPAVDAVVRHGRGADLVVLGQQDPDFSTGNFPADLAQRVLVELGRPVLVVPYAGHFEGLPRNVVVAWDGTRESAVALQAAIPALQRAATVTLMSFLDEGDSEGEERLLLPDTIQYLMRHGINVFSVRDFSAVDIDIADALLSRISDAGADMLVMGAYGHSRFRELMLGGVTRKILGEMTVPVLMAH